jgi:intracellular multiplication protein IcmD
MLKKYQKSLLLLAFLSVVSFAFAEDAVGISGVANKLTTTIASVGKMMVALSYLAGFGFLTFGVLKFKQHKDNPSQVPLGTPIVMTLIGAVLVFIGGFIAPLGETFGLKKEDAGTAPTPKA